MIAAQDPQTQSEPKPGFGIPWSVAAILAGVGALVLLFSLNPSSHHGESNMARLEKETADLDKQLAKSDSEIAALRESGKGPATELKAREEKNKGDAESIAHREGGLKTLEASNRKKIEQVQAQIAETNRLIEKEKQAIASQPDADDVEKTK